MAENSVRKIWGLKTRLLENSLCEIDILKLEKKSKCSWHNHEHKYNRFLLIMGDVRVNTSLGSHKLEHLVPFDVEPNLFHEFEVKKDSLMLEIAFVKEGKIDPDDIFRVRQGGKFINGQFLTHEEINKQNNL